MGDIQSKRSVLPFPAEIRLEIYRCLVSRVYLAMTTTPERCIYHPDYNNKPLEVQPGLVILRVSKATSSEALKLLYDESVFVFKLDFATPFFCDILSQKAAALMSNVWIEVSAKITSPKPRHAEFFFTVGGLSKQQLMTRRTIGLFTGTTCFRNLMRIKFMDCAASIPLCMPHVFLKAMKDLGGFRKLVIDFDFPRILEPDCSTPGTGFECERLKDSFLQSHFEPAYGPAVQHAVRGVGRYTCYLGFHPRQQLAVKLMAKAEKMLEDAARLRG